MRKFIFGIILLGIILFTAFSIGPQAVLSKSLDPPNIPDQEQYIAQKDLEVSTPAMPELDKPEINLEQETNEEGEKDLTYDEVLALINDTDKKTVENPHELLVLVNKNNNLPSGYVPEDLVKPNVRFSFQGDDEKQYLKRDAALALEELFSNGEKNGYNFFAVSGYRSYERQKAIFLNNVQKYGFKKANFFSALPGQSEHQTGLAMDVSSQAANFRLVESFGRTPEGIWLKDNAHLYGFIIRYPKEKVGITGYQYEPWHIRYVGIENATQMKMNDLVLEEFLSE